MPLMHLPRQRLTAQVWINVMVSAPILWVRHPSSLTPWAAQGEASAAAVQATDGKQHTGHRTRADNNNNNQSINQSINPSINQSIKGFLQNFSSPQKLYVGYQRHVAIMGTVEAEIPPSEHDPTADDVLRDDPPPNRPMLVRGLSATGSHDHSNVKQLVLRALRHLPEWASVDVDDLGVQDISGWGGTSTLKISIAESSAKPAAAGAASATHGGRRCNTAVVVHLRNAEFGDNVGAAYRTAARLAAVTKVLAVAGLAPKRLAHGRTWFIDEWMGEEEKAGKAVVDDAKERKDDETHSNNSGSNGNPNERIDVEGRCSRRHQW